MMTWPRRARTGPAPDSAQRLKTILEKEDYYDNS